MERSVEANVSTQTPPPTVEIGKRNGDWRKKVPVEQSNKRKTVSPLEDKKVDRMKRAKRGDTSYAGVCKKRIRDDDDPRDRETSDFGGECIVQTSRRERRRERKRSKNEERRPPLNEGRRERLPRNRNRSETLLVKVRESEQWLQTHKKFMVAKEALCESTGVTCIKNGDILVELEAGVKGGGIALKIKG